MKKMLKSLVAVLICLLMVCEGQAVSIFATENDTKVEEMLGEVQQVEETTLGGQEKDEIPYNDECDGKFISDENDSTENEENNSILSDVYETLSEDERLSAEDPTYISEKQILEYFYNTGRFKIGSEYPDAMCLSFVADVFQDLGATRDSDCCANHYANNHIESESAENIPIGADVYFNWGDNYSYTVYTCPNCGNLCHHIGIYLGKDELGNKLLVHNSNGRIIRSTFSDLESWGMYYRGWGYHGHVSLTSDADKYIEENHCPVEVFNARCTIDAKDSEGKRKYCTTVPIWSMPCSNKTDARSKKILAAWNGLHYDITRKIVNSAGNTWYEIRTSNGCGYVFCENVIVRYGTVNEPIVKLFAVNNDKDKIPLRKGYYQTADANYIYRKDQEYLAILGETVNDKGNKWYVVSNGMYVYSGNVHYINDVGSVDGLSAVEAGYTVQHGNSGYVCFSNYSFPRKFTTNSYVIKPNGLLRYSQNRGGLKAGAGGVKKARVTIYNRDRGIIQRITIPLSSGQADIADIADELEFNSLDPGYYYYCVDLVDGSIVTSIMDVGFTVNGEETEDYYYYDDSVNYIVENGVLVGYTGVRSSLDVPDGVTKIADSCFRDNTRLRYINLPDSVTEIGSYAFYRCTNLRAINLPTAVTSIGDYAFSYCDNLGSISLPNGIKKIGDWGFSGARIEEIVIPDSVEEIGVRAFSFCDWLQKVKLPNNDKVLLAAFQFAGCKSLEDVEIPKLMGRAANIYPWEAGYSIAPFTGCNVQNITFGEGIEEIPDYFFDNCRKLETVVIPDSVKIIHRGAFRGCSSLKNLTLSSNIEEIHDDAFFFCDALEEVYIPNSCRVLGEKAFFCDNLASVHLPDNENIESVYRTFGSEKLTHVTIPKSWGNLICADEAFAYCLALTDITIEDGLTKIPEKLFSRCAKITSIVLPDSVTEIEENAFEHDQSLSNVRLSNNLVKIGDGAFWGCSLKSLVLPDSIEEIGGFAFYGCDVESLRIPYNIKDLWYGEFRNMSLEEVILPYGLRRIGNDAFVINPDLETVFIPSSVSYISDYAFDETVCIECAKNSYAEQWAKKNGIQYRIVERKARDFEVLPLNPLIGVNGKVRLIIKPDPEDTTDQAVIKPGDLLTYVYEDEVHGITEGTATVNISMGEINKKIYVRVGEEAPMPTSLNLNPSELDLFVGQSDTIQFVTDTGDIPIDKTTITNSSDSVVSFEEDLVQKTILVHALTEGTSVIKVSVGDLEEFVTINVTTPMITFKDQDGTDMGIEPIPAAYGQRFPELPKPQKDGYIFAGWFTGKNKTGEAVFDSTIFNGQTVLYAGWIEDDEKITVLPVESVVYTGSAIMVEPAVYDGITLLEKDKDYTLSYSNNKDAGKGYVIVNGKGNYSKKETIEFTILPKPIGDGNAFDEAFSVSIADKQYTGKTLTSKPTIKLGKITLKENKDYTLHFDGDLINPGTVIVTVTGKENSNFTGEAKISYQIYRKQQSLSGAVITLDKRTIPYSPVEEERRARVVSVKVNKDAEDMLEEGTDYTVSYKNADKTGTATVTVTGINGYGGSKSVTYKITSKPLDSTSVVIALAGEENIAFTGSALKPAVTVSENDHEIPASCYSVSYANTTNAAKADAINSKTKKSIAPTVTVKFKGNYSGTASKTFEIKPKELSAGDLSISFPNVKDTGKDLDASMLKPTVKYGTKTLKKDTDYQVIYEEDDLEVKTVDIKPIGNYTCSQEGLFVTSFLKYPTVTDISAVTVTCEEGPFVYSRSKITPIISASATIDGILYTLVPGKDYTVSYSNNTNAMASNENKAPTYTVTGKGAFKGKTTGTFTIEKQELSKDSFTVTVADIKYNKGNEVKPKVTVTDEAGKALKANKDYRVVYSNNKAKAEKEDDATPTVTIEGLGNYKTPDDPEKVLSAKFRIYDKEISSVTVDKIESRLYTGAQIKPEDVVVYSDKKKDPASKLTKNVHYTISYGENRSVGKGTVILTGMGEYGGTKTVTFIILPKWLQWLIM